MGFGMEGKQGPNTESPGSSLWHQQVRAPGRQPSPQGSLPGFQLPLILYPFGSRGVNVALLPDPEHCAMLPLLPPHPSVNGPFIKRSSNHPV